MFLSAMITFKPTIVTSNKRKDGTYAVIIRITYEGKSRRLPTTLVCYPQDLTRSMKIKSADVLAKADDLIKRMRTITNDISPFDLDGKDVDWVVDRIRRGMTADNFSLDFFEWGEKYILCKSESTRCAYITAMNALERFLGERRLDINAITKGLLLDFVDFVDNEPKMHYNPKTKKWEKGDKNKIAKASSSRHLMKLAHIFNSAKDRYNDEDAGRIVIPRSPFATITKVFPPSQGQKNLGQELMQRIISADTDDESVRIALDAFIVSFGLMGANMADLYLATPFKGTWVYNRQKTRTRRADKAEMRVDIPVELHPFISRLQEAKGEWWLPVLHRIGGEKDTCTAKVNSYLKRWCETEGIPPFTFYAGRHTWASLARKAGVEKATIDDCLCHKGDFAMADIYADKSWELMQEANRKVLDLFEW